MSDADTAPSPAESDADALPSIPPWRPSDGPQAGPGWVMTSHGPIRRAMPPWDVPAAPDDARTTPPRVVELWTSAAVDQLLVGLGIPLSSFAYRVERDQWESNGEASIRIVDYVRDVHRTAPPPAR